MDETTNRRPLTGTRYYTANSVYEVKTDGESTWVRRVMGINAPTPRVGEDNVWKIVASVSSLGPPGVEGLLIRWEAGGTKCTWTSMVTKSEPIPEGQLEQ